MQLVPKQPSTERQYVDFDLEKFSDEVGLSVNKLASKVFVSAPTMYNWVKEKKVPLSVYKALIVATAPTKAEQYERELVIKERTSGASRLTIECFTLAREYDKLRPGARIPMEGGGWWMIPDKPAGLPEVQAAIIESSDPADQLPAVPRIPAQLVPSGAAPKFEEQLDAMFTLASRLRVQRDDAIRNLAQMSARFDHDLARARTARQDEIISLEQQLRDAQASLVIAQEEAKTWKELAEQATDPNTVAGHSPAQPEVVRHLAQKAAKEFPSLTEEIKSLPFQPARRN